MQCERCSQHLTEGNFLYLPMTQQTPRGTVSTFIHAILCDSCAKTVPNSIVGSAKLIEAEIVT